MSERLNSAEIEDVLSSIRRLVSEDLRPVPKADPAPPRVAEEGPGKLLLTPALRITPVATDEGEATETPADAGPAPFHSVRGEADAGRLLLLGEVARSLDGATEEDAAPPPQAAMPAWFGAAEPAPLVPVADGAEAAPEAEVAVWQAAVEAVVEPVAEPPVPAALETEVDALHWAARGMSEAEEAALAAEAGDVPAPSAVEAAMAADEPADLPEWARMEAEAPPEAEVAAAELRPTAATARADDPDWADAAEAEIRRELEQETEATVFARFEPAGDAPDEPFYDEEMLRDLVRDIIREELQGALGERITRNVRKLVRAEIARALAVRDFE